VALITRTQIIERPIGEVFATVIDAGNYAGWNPTIKASRRLDQGELGAGSRFEWKLQGFGTVTQELQDFRRNEHVRLVPLDAPIAGGHRFVFTAQGESTCVDHELEMLPRGIYRLFAPLLALIGRRNLRATAAALQMHLEATSSEGVRR
jgi:polyketide cyclase/dehydrase/lipid transport protein